MSLLAVQGGATGTGTVTLLAPVTNTNRTLTLPDATGTVLSSATTTGFPAGSVLQVVSKQITTETSTSSASFVDLTDFSQAITPSSASSKILVFFSVQSFVNNASNNSPVRLLRGSTGLQDYDYWNYNGAGTSMLVGSYSYLDSPNTTSSVTYKLQGRSTNGGIGQSVNFIYDDVNGDAKGSITLMEIAA
jgi:hypothetical protein